MLRRRILRATFQIGLGLVIYLAFVQSSLAQEGPPYNIILLIDNSPSITEGLGAFEEGVPTDLEDKRIRFSRFLVQYMQAFYPDQAQIGAIGFADVTRTLVPVQPVEQWSSADLASIAEEKMGSPTRFIPGLREAYDILHDSSCLQQPGRCYVVIFTDGKFVKGAETESVESRLDKLMNTGIQVVVVMFAGHPPSEGVNDWRSALHDTRETWEQAGATVIPDSHTLNTSELTAGEVYHEILETLAADGPFAVLREREFLGKTTLAVPVSPFQRYTQLFLLSDTIIDEVWTPEPDIKTGVERWWIDPTEGAIMGTLQASADTMSTLIYYTFRSEPYPISIETQIIPDRLETGRSVQCQGWFAVGGRVITETEGFGMQSHLEPMGISLPLERQEGGWFVQTTAMTVPGTYTVTFTPILPSILAGASIAQTQNTFYVGEVPRLHLHTGDLVAMAEGFRLPVTITVENYATIAGLYTPTLRVEAVGQQHTTALSHQDNGPFFASIIVSSTADLALHALLPGGSTSQGVPFDPAIAEKSLVLRSGRIRSNSPWPALGVLAVLLIVTSGVALKLRKRAGQTFRPSELQAVLACPPDEISSEDIVKVFKDSDHFIPEWQKFARELSSQVMQTLSSNPDESSGLGS